MVNPRYRPFNGNSRKPIKKQAEVKLSETKQDFLFPEEETYKYIIGQINALEATKQEISNLLNDKEQNEGTVVDINTKNSSTK